MSARRRAQIFRELAALFGELAAVEDAPEPGPPPKAKVRRLPPPPRVPAHAPSDLDRKRAEQDLRGAGYRLPRKSA